MNTTASRHWGRPYLRTLVFLLVAVSALPLFAQTIDGFEFGKNSAAAVRLATQLDYLTIKCQGRRTATYVNLVDYVLRRINGRSVQLVIDNAARVTGASAEEIRRLAIDEADRVLSQSGGCGSKETQAVIQGASAQLSDFVRYLANIAEITERSGGRNIIR